MQDYDVLYKLGDWIYLVVGLAIIIPIVVIGLLGSGANIQEWKNAMDGMTCEQMWEMLMTVESPASWGFDYYNTRCN